MSATATQPKRSASAAAPVRFGKNPKPLNREKIVPRTPEGTQRIMVDYNDPFQSLLVGSFNMNSGVIESAPMSSRPNTPASIFANDPVSAPRDPVRLSAKIDFELDRVGQLAEKLKELSSAPTLLPIPTSQQAQPAPQVSSLPVEVLERTRKSARDAWCAVVMMGAFIVAGIAWTSNRLDTADKRITQLLEQLEIQQNSANTLRTENQQAFSELADVKAKLKALQYENSASSR